jgi:hypothetical protein
VVLVGNDVIAMVGVVKFSQNGVMWFYNGRFSWSKAQTILCDVINESPTSTYLINQLAKATRFGYLCHHLHAFK